MSIDVEYLPQDAGDIELETDNKEDDKDDDQIVIVNK